MKEINYLITDELGLHARPAGLLVKQAQKYKSDITVRKGEKSGNAKRIFNVMSLAVKKGDRVIFSINGEDEEPAAEELDKFLKENL